MRLTVAQDVMKEKEQNNNLVEKRFIFRERYRKRKEELQKEIFSADLTIVFVLVTVLSVPCSFGGWSVQIQRLEEGDFWVPHMSRVSHGMTVFVCTMLLAVAYFDSSQDSMLHRWHQRKERDVSLKNTRTCGGTADVLIAACDWLFFSQSQGT